MNIFEALREDHEKQRTLIKILVKTHGDSDGRKEIFAKLKDELNRHAAAEERNFYVPLMQHDLTQEKARHSVAEHKELDDFIEELETTDPSSSGWVATAKKMADRLIHHLDEEEHEIFQIAGKALTEKQKTDLAQDYKEMMEERK